LTDNKRPTPPEAALFEVLYAEEVISVLPFRFLYSIPSVSNHCAW